MSVESGSEYVDHNGNTRHFLHSTGVDLDRFHVFAAVPETLQNQIFKLASPPARTHFLEVYQYDPSRPSCGIRYIPPLPALFHTTCRSREAIIEAQGGDLIYFHTPPKNTKFYFNFAHDILYLSSRFVPYTHTTETSRLREMNSLVPFFYIQRFRRVVVTYSGIDDYSKITNQMHWLQGMETMYIAMMDWWSNRSVKSLLRKGIPGTGSVSDYISFALEEQEANETDDDDEDEEDKARKLEVRARRRIVECQLKLDE